MPRDSHNRSRYWLDRRVPGLSLLRADFTDHDYPTHTHEAYVIAVTEEGGALIRSRNAVQEAKPSQLFVSNPGDPHAAWMGSSHRWRYRALYLMRSGIDEIAGTLGIPSFPHFARDMFADADLIQSFLALHCALEEGHDLFAQQELLATSFGALLQRHGERRTRIASAVPDRTLLGKAVDLMKARYSEALHLDTVAAAVGLTPFQLIDLFKRTTGFTAHAYLMQLRLNAACRFLRRGIPISEAAPAAGFYDQSALTNTFRRWYGVTPRQFAQAARA